MTPGCEWYTYDTADGFCSAYATCPIVDPSCRTCTSGEDECPALICDVEQGCTGILVKRGEIWLEYKHRGAGGHWQRWRKKLLFKQETVTVNFPTWTKEVKDRTIFPPFQNYKAKKCDNAT